MTVADRLRATHARIEAACAAHGRDPAGVRLVAVSKRQPDLRLREAYAAGHRDFGENYVQELERKRLLLPDDAHWHLIGHLQRNKAKRVTEAFLVHTLDSERLARALSDAARAAGRRVPVLVEVNLAAEATKTGVSAEGAPALVVEASRLPGLEVRGLMCVPPPGQGPAYFAQLASLARVLRAETGLALPELSMGMSDDFEDAIRAGATLIRVGTALFGPRPAPPSGSGGADL